VVEQRLQLYMDVFELQGNKVLLEKLQVLWKKASEELQV